MKRSSTVLLTVGATPCEMSAGSIPARPRPSTVTPPTHTGVKSFAAALALNWSGRKLEACSVVSHCGVR